MKWVLLLGLTATGCLDYGALYRGDSDGGAIDLSDDAHVDLSSEDSSTADLATDLATADLSGADLELLTALPFFRTATSQAYSSVTFAEIPAPAGAQADDLIVVTVLWSSSATSLNYVKDSMNNTIFPKIDSATSGFHRMVVCARKGAVGPFTAMFSASADATLIVSSYAGATTVTPYLPAVVEPDDPPPTVQPSNNTGLLVVSVGDSQSSVWSLLQTSWTAPSTYTANGSGEGAFVYSAPFTTNQAVTIQSPATTPAKYFVAVISLAP